MRTIACAWMLLRTRRDRSPLQVRGGRRCPVCGTAVRADDAVGLLRGTYVHAECALAEWLRGSSRRDRVEAGALLDRLSGRIPA